MTNLTLSAGRVTGTPSQSVLWFGSTLILLPTSFVIVGIVLYLLFSNPNATPDYVLFTILLFVCMGGISAAVQYRFMRPVHLDPRLWIGVSTCAAALGAFIGFGLFVSSRASTSLLYQLEAATALDWSKGLLYNLISAALVGGCIGTAQSILLWKRLRAAYWWLIMTVIVWELWAWVGYIQECHAAAYRCM